MVSKSDHALIIYSTKHEADKGRRQIGQSNGLRMDENALKLLFGTSASKLHCQKFTQRMSQRKVLGLKSIIAFKQRKLSAIVAVLGANDHR